MFLRKQILTFLLLTLFVGVAVAQSAKLKRAKTYMSELNYIGAIQLYNGILAKEDVAEAKINLAECYRKVNDTQNAEYWYGQVVKLPEVQPVHKLYYGQALQANGKCDLAKEWFEKFITEAPDDLRGQYQVKSCDNEESLMTKSASIYEIKHLDFNSNLDDFGAAYFNEGIVFASERDKGSVVKRQHTWTGNPFLELYYVEAKKINGESCGKAQYGRPEKFSGKVNSKFHEAAATFHKSELYFTRNNYLNGKTGRSDDGIVKLKVYSATTKDKGNSWTEFESLPFNSDEYNVAHPTLSNDGKRIFFASDMPGGFGGMDLYTAEREGKKWGPATNLGPQINTEANELFPFYNKDSRLYFASNGHTGLGGLDIYYVEDKGNNEYSLPENIGFPLNSKADDFAISFNDNGTCGFFSSDREGGAGRDDIYSFQKIAVPVEVYVFDEVTKLPIEGAEVTNTCTNAVVKTGKNGIVTMDMKPNTCCTYKASQADYPKTNEKEGCTKELASADKVRVEIPLKKEDNTKYSLEGFVFDLGTGLPLEGATVTLTNDCKKPEQTLTTDATGRFTFDLDKDCCYKVKGDKTDYMSATVDSLCTKNLKEIKTLKAVLNLQPTKLITSTSGGNKPTSIYKDPATGLYMDPNTGKPANYDNPNGISYKNGEMYVNSRKYNPNDASNKKSETFDTSPTPVENGGAIAYLLHIYYDFDQSYIRDEAESELIKLQTMMTDNPKYIIEIGSHTDARGSSNYNVRLSQRRADAVVRWLSDKGIARERLIGRGYGETVNVNNCKNNVPCSEQEHQMNRRTEFKIIGYVGEQNVNISHPNENARVDACKGCPF
jgi:outer membrane protein OmpA-like peptidoglycan-associated protein/tetratricopeptide (TPR) repeat protein